MTDEMLTPRIISYFSMEMALESHLPTYSGGLGVLAGDTLRSAADLGLPMVGVTLLHRKGYFFQRLDDEGHQHEEPAAWPIEEFLQPTDGTCQVEVEGRQVTVRAWRYPITGDVRRRSFPVLLLDTDVPENDPYDRSLTDFLYGGDERYRLCQEVILGVGGVRMLRALGYHRVAQVPHERGARGPAGPGAVRRGAQAHRRPARGCHRAGEAHVRVHHPHAGAGGPRPVSPRAWSKRVLSPEQWEALRTFGLLRPGR